MHQKKPLRKESLLRQVMNYFMIIFGTFVTACGIALFSNPAKITGGGVTGVGTILYYTFGWDPGLVMLLINVPLYLLGAKIFGSRYGFKVLLGSTMLSVWVTLLGSLTDYQGFLDYPESMAVLLSALCYGVLCGAGIGIVMRSGSNCGGTDILAQIVSKYTPFAVGSAEFVLNAGVVAIGGLFFGLESTLFAFIAMFISGRMINYVVAGMGTGLAKTVYIFSMHHVPDIAQSVIAELHHGGTVFQGVGIYTAQDRPMLMVVIPNQQFQTLVRIIHRQDPDAFVFVGDTYLVMGNGFAALNKLAESENN